MMLLTCTIIFLCQFSELCHGWCHAICFVWKSHRAFVNFLLFHFIRQQMQTTAATLNNKRVSLTRNVRCSCSCIIMSRAAVQMASLRIPSKQKMSKVRSTKVGPKKKYVVFPVTVVFPTDPIFGPDPKVFIQIFLFLIKSCIILFVCQTRLGSLGVVYKL